MTDIRDDFKKWQKSNPDPAIRQGYYETHLFEAYQAGRAHDIDGLIAEIEKELGYGNGYEAGIDAALRIIRKHFGKE